MFNMCLSFPESRHIVRYKIVSVTHLVLPTLTTSWTIRAFEKDVSSTSGARARDSAKKRLKSVYFVNCLREWRTYYVRIYRYPPDYYVFRSLSTSWNTPELFFIVWERIWDDWEQLKKSPRNRILATQS